jgi:hypothetical protein
MRQFSKTLSAIVFTATFAGISAGTAALAYPGDAESKGILDLNGTGTASSMDQGNWTKMEDRNSTMGMITGISNDADGNPAWLLAGHWKVSYDSNSTAIGSETASGNVSDFNSMIHMVMLNGSAMHSHDLSNFTQTEEATFNSTANSTTYIGTVTITMRDGPVNDVGTRLTITDSVLRIDLDGTMINDHFGGSPIYGITVSHDMMDKHKGMMSRTMIQETGNVTSSMNDSWLDNSTSASGIMDENWE